ncbi:2TM domain-containing protein [Spongiivirga sp. MCCC 1A20706]|uniref:2TM domain-containing protein n=1 Tax=Spongiivirga sp. MCCC 1A20706 TaxID=3160963 RepID=UPI003977ABF4
MNKEYKQKHVLKRVKDIKGFYTHLVVYILINALLTIVHLWIDSKGYYGENPYGINYWGTPLLWGVGLLIHAFKVFGLSNWEDRKIKELMEKDNLTAEYQKEIDESRWE